MVNVVIFIVNCNHIVITAIAYDIIALALGMWHNFVA